jgi:hypothetical protein
MLKFVFGEGGRGHEPQIPSPDLLMGNWEGSSRGVGRACSPPALPSGQLFHALLSSIPPCPLTWPEEPACRLQVRLRGRAGPPPDRAGREATLAASLLWEGRTPACLHLRAASIPVAAPPRERRKGPAYLFLRAPREAGRLLEFAVGRGRRSVVLGSRS